MTTIEIINSVLIELDMKAPTLAKNIGIKYQRIFDIQQGKTKRISPDVANAIVKNYPRFNLLFLLTGEGEMLNTVSVNQSIVGNSNHQIGRNTGNIKIKHVTGYSEQRSEEKAAYQKDGNLIPFYDDVRSIGGMNMTAPMEGVITPSEYIDTGDWFREATAAIRHYGNSMTEYPEGCILALKEVIEKQLIIWGRDYVIETSEYRITKRVQRGKDDSYIKAYSSNTETYPDGQLIHEPLDIAWTDISRISLVLGYVVKKNGGTIVYSNKK